MDGFGGCEGDGLLLGRLGLEINSWMGRMGHGEMNSWMMDRVLLYPPSLFSLRKTSGISFFFFFCSHDENILCTYSGSAA
jgi:hypothetical protein